MNPELIRIGIDLITDYQIWCAIATVSVDLYWWLRK